MISISFPTNGSWQLGKFVNTEEDVNGYITLKYIEITNNTGQDLSGKPFFIEFIGPDFDALKWEFTPLSVLQFDRDYITIVLADGTAKSTYILDEVADVLYVVAPPRIDGYDIQYSVDGTNYDFYASVPEGSYKLIPVNQDGIVGRHIYFTDQYGNILKFWRIAFDYPKKYTAYVIQLKTIDDVPILFPNNSTIKIYIMTNAPSSYAQDLSYPPFVIIHPQIPGYITGLDPDTITVTTSNIIATDTYLTGVDSAPQLCIEGEYVRFYNYEDNPRSSAFGYLEYYHEADYNGRAFFPIWVTDLEILDTTGWTTSSTFIQLGHIAYDCTGDYKITDLLSYFHMDSNTSNEYYGLYVKAPVVIGGTLEAKKLFAPLLEQRFISSFTSWVEKDQYIQPVYGYIKGLTGISEYDSGHKWDAYACSTTSCEYFKLYLNNGVKVYRIMGIGFIPEIMNLVTGDDTAEKADKIVRFYDIPRNFTTGTAGYWLSPIIDLGMQPPDFSISWVADETYGRIDTDNIDPKEIEWRYSIYPPAGTATGTITDSDGVEHAYWDPEATWDTASEWQKIESNEQLPPYRYAQFRISLLAD